VTVERQPVERASWAGWIEEQTRPETVPAKPQALDHLLVLDTSQGSFAGLVAGAILAEFGAEVVRVEPPAGDIARRFSPYSLYHLGTGLPYLVEARNKHHITLHLGTARGRELFTQLATRADVLIETSRPGQFDALGIGYRQLAARNPRLIYLAITTYGQFGHAARANRHKPSYDVMDQALSGIVYVTGEPASGPHPAPHEVPTRTGSWLGWYAGGTWGAFAVLTALLNRRRSGRGQMLDVTGAEGLARFMENMVLWYEKSGRIKERLGLLDLSVFPYTLVACQDGYAMIAGYTDENFRALCEVMGAPALVADPRFRTYVDRLAPQRKGELHQIIEAWSCHLTADEILAKAMAVMSRGRRAGVVVTGHVNTPLQTLAEEHWWLRGLFRRVQDPTYGELLLQMPIWKMTETPPRVRWACRRVGQDNEEVLSRYLGLDREALSALRQEGVV
jgi:crotonobetainyl-CoA:carnitine CoA-transferase CaiB-like acyl-CoA transferase